MVGLPGYDDWLTTPPEFEEDEVCGSCMFECLNLCTNAGSPCFDTMVDDEDVCDQYSPKEYDQPESD